MSLTQQERIPISELKEFKKTGSCFNNSPEDRWPQHPLTPEMPLHVIPSLRRDTLSLNMEALLSKTLRSQAPSKPRYSMIHAESMLVFFGKRSKNIWSVAVAQSWDAQDFPESKLWNEKFAVNKVKDSQAINRMTFCF